MPGKFIITKTPKGFFRFSLQAANYVTILTSQNYTTLKACRDGIASVKKNATVQVEDQTLQNIAIAEEGYSTKSGCMNGIESISRAIVDAVTDESALEKV